MSALYDKAKEKFLKGEIDLLDDTIKAILVDSADYTRNYTTDEYLDDIPAAARVKTSGALSGKAVTGGAFDASDTTFSTVTGDSCEYIVLYKEGASSDVSPLVACIDSGTGLPVTPNGGDIKAAWDNGTNKIFKLG